MNLLVDPRISRLAAITFWLALVFACVMAMLPHPPATPLDRLGDKSAHMLAFFTLGGLASLAYGRSASWRILERLSFLGAIIEVVQSIPGLHRQCDITDWLADCAAAGLAVLLVRLVLPEQGNQA